MKKAKDLHSGERDPATALFFINLNFYDMQYYKNELLEAFNAEMATNLPPQARAEYERALRRQRKAESESQQQTLF